MAIVRNVLSAATLVFITASCAFEAGDPGEQEPIADQAQEFGEDTCATSATPNAHLTVGGTACNWSDYASSSGSGYGQTYCPNQYLADVDTWDTYPVTGYGISKPTNIPTNQTDCQNTYVQVAVWRMSTVFPFNWYKEGQSSGYGTWVNLGMFSYCAATRSVAFTTPHLGLRVSGKVVRSGAKQPVTVGFVDDC